MKKNINRLGIFCFYDKYGIVDEYVEIILQELIINLKKLIIVVNGSISSCEKNKLERFTKYVICRENIGFDAGAYKYVLKKYISFDELSTYDELVLCNDTFYGPFVSFEKIFSDMNNCNTDFWGLSYIELGFLSHIQSYFIVYRKNVITNKLFYNYILLNIDDTASDINNVYANFESVFFNYLTKSGFTSTVYKDVKNVNLYKSSSYLLKECGLPILKKKAFNKDYYVHNNVMESLKYIMLQTDYNIELILENIDRLYQIKIDKMQIYDFTLCDNEFDKFYVTSIYKSEQELMKFIENLDEIFIYGVGIMANHIFSLLRLNNYKVAGFIISDYVVNEKKDIYNLPIYKLKQISNINSGIVVALNRENTMEVKESLKGFKNVFYLH